MDVMIGVDPHKGSHTATMLDRAEHELGRIKVRAGRRQVAELLEWADGHGRGRGRWSRPVGWAICCPSSSSPPARRCWMCRRRWRHGCGCWAPGQSTKTDPNDARSVAVAALQAPTLAAVRPADHVTVCRLLAKHHTDLARWRNKLCCRLHALVGELVPGGIDKEVVVNQARSLLDEHRTATTWPRSSGTARPSSSSTRSTTSTSSMRRLEEHGSPPRWRRRGRR